MRAPTVCWWSSVGHDHARSLSSVARPWRARSFWSRIFAGVASLASACYLSLITPGDFFFSFQWDILLLETGFLAFFFAPWQWRLDADRIRRFPPWVSSSLRRLSLQADVHVGRGEADQRRSVLVDLTALNYHYGTQPLPTGSWLVRRSEASRG